MPEGGGVGRELVYCHSCENEWYKNAAGLTCPECQSGAVEVIEPDSDPTVPPGEIEDILHSHAPWPVPNAPDPEEADVTTYEWSGPGIHFSSVTYRSPPPGSARAGSQGPPLLNPMAQIFQSVFAATGGRVDDRSGQQQEVPSSRYPTSPMPGNERSPFPPQLPNPFFPFSADLQHPPSPFGRPHATTTIFGPQGGFIIDASSNSPASRTGPPGFEDLHGIFTSLLGPLPPNQGQAGPTPNNPLSLFHALFNPANARAGDAVYTQEALDRVVSQLMEQHAGDTAPGPASEAAIAALPRIPMATAMLDDQGKADCSICMDEVPLGGFVVELPCKHWFHAACVASWLREHDTCPQCRRGIMPKEGEGEGPRQTGQTPRNMSWLWGNGSGGSSSSSSGGGGGGPGPGTGSTQRSESRHASASTGWPALVETASARLGIRRGDNRRDSAMVGTVQDVSATAATSTTTSTAQAPTLPSRHPQDGESNQSRGEMAPGEAATRGGERNRDRDRGQDRDHERASHGGAGSTGSAGSAASQPGLAGWLGRRFGG